MFTYNDLTAQAAATGGDVGDIGNTVLGYPIIYVHKGDYVGAQTLFFGGIHAREYITAPLLLRMAQAYSGDAGIWFVPLVNVDGALLSQFGVSSVSSPVLRESLLALNGGSSDFSLWKANIRGVDLNVNFNAEWGTGAQNVRYPGAENYIGAYPVSEPETQALVTLTENVRFALTLAYHTKGEEVYYGFLNNDNFGEEAARLAETVGYPLLRSTGSAGGYKDWFTLSFGRLGLTVECGDDSFAHPYPESELNNLYERHKDMPQIAADTAERLAIKYL